MVGVKPRSAGAALDLSPSVLDIDAAAVAHHIGRTLRDQVVHRLRRRGVVVGLSGGIDSSVVAGLAARALGPERVVALLMPERESSSDSAGLAGDVAAAFSISTVVEDITGVLEAAGCYRRRDAAIRSVLPDYGEGYRSKIVLPDLIGRPGYALYSIVIQAPAGEEIRVRLPLEAYLEIVAATNFKQRVRTMTEYYHADRLRYAVAGTANRLEHDLGFFVKQGDGAADLKPIAHLYKSQVYQLAEYLDVPDAIRRRPPTTDTYSLDQSQEEFFFGLSLRQTDLLLYARDHGLPPEAAADALGLPLEQTTRAYGVVDSKRHAARYLLMPPLTIEHQETGQ
jgi:NAD+ synthase